MTSSAQAKLFLLCQPPRANASGSDLLSGTCMCRNIKTLFNYEPPVTEEELHLAVLQFVRKVSGMNKPSKDNEAAFLAAVDAIAAACDTLLGELTSNAAPKNRAQQEALARARNAQRFSP